MKWVWLYGHRSISDLAGPSHREGRGTEEHLKAALVTLDDLHLWMTCLTHWGLLGFWGTAERSQSMVRCGLLTLGMEKATEAASGVEHQA